MDDTIAALRQHADNAHNADSLCVEPTITHLAAEIPSESMSSTLHAEVYREMVEMQELATDELPENQDSKWGRDTSTRVTEQLEKLLVATRYVDDIDEWSPLDRNEPWCRRTTADGEIENSYPSSLATYHVRPHFRRIVVLCNNIGDPDNNRFRRSEILCSTVTAEAKLNLRKVPEMLNSGHPCVTVLSVADHKVRVLHTCFLAGEPILAYTPYFDMTKVAEIHHLLYATFCTARVVEWKHQSAARLRFHQHIADLATVPGDTFHDYFRLIEQNSPKSKEDIKSTRKEHGSIDTERARLLAMVFASVMGIFLFLKGTTSRAT